MKPVWVLDVFDLKKSVIKVQKLDSTVAKTYFVPNLIDAKLHLNTLLATSKDCMWLIDIESGVRRRVTEKILNSPNYAHQAEHMANVVDVPEFLKKRAI